MAAVPNQLQHDTMDSINRIQIILNRELVTVNDDANGHPVSHPYINMSAGQIGQDQNLLVAGERFPLKTARYTLRGTLYPGLAFAKYYRLSQRSVQFKDPEGYLYYTPTFKRNMVFTNYNGGRGNWGGMFAQIDTRDPVGRPSGPQAELVQHGKQQRLYIIDIDTARRLAIQCTNWSNTDRSLTYDLVTAAYELLTTLTTILYRFYDLNLSEGYVNILRTHIYRFGELIIERLVTAKSVEDIYKVAIVRQEGMDNIMPDPQLEHSISVVNLPNINGIAFEPYIAADIDAEQIRQHWMEESINIYGHIMFGKPWINIFRQFASRNNSIRFLDIEEGHMIHHRYIHLPNDHNIDIAIKRLNDDTYRLQSTAFTNATNGIYLLKSVPELPQWCLFRNRGNQCYLPVHSHGLNGSNQYAVPHDFDYNGNNGYQVMALMFNIELLDNSFETSQRIYFVNREMARELRYYFVTQQVMARYQRWFRWLIRVSRRLSDAYRLLRYQNNHNDDDQHVVGINICINQLDQLARQLFEDYECLVKLEQIWRYSVLVPNTDPQRVKHKEQAITSLFSNPAIYRLGRHQRLFPRRPPR